MVLCQASIASGKTLTSNEFFMLHFLRKEKRTSGLVLTEQMRILLLTGVTIRNWISSGGLKKYSPATAYQSGVQLHNLDG